MKTSSAVQPFIELSIFQYILFRIPTWDSENDDYIGKVHKQIGEYRKMFYKESRIKVFRWVPRSFHSKWLNT